MENDMGTGTSTDTNVHQIPIQSHFKGIARNTEAMFIFSKEKHHWNLAPKMRIQMLRNIEFHL